MENCKYTDKRMDFIRLGFHSTLVQNFKLLYGVVERGIPGSTSKLPANAGKVWDTGWIRVERSLRMAWQSAPVLMPGGESKVRGAWWARGHRFTKSRTWLKQLTTHAWQKEYRLLNWIRKPLKFHFYFYYNLVILDKYLT